MSVLLLIERKRAGRGPKIPLKGSYTRARVEGLTGGLAAIACTSSPRDRTVFHSDGEYNLAYGYEKGEIVCGELEGTGCITIQLEE